MQAFGILPIIGKKGSKHVVNEETPEQAAATTRFCLMIYDKSMLSVDYDETYFIVRYAAVVTLYKIRRTYVYKHPIEQVKRVCDMAYRQSQDALKGIDCGDRIQYRCGCCGCWEWMFKIDWHKLDPEKYKFCEGCSLERTGPGRKQCVYCELPTSITDHWRDERPNPPVMFVC